MDKNIGFASDMRVNLYNTSDALFSKDISKQYLGEFSVPVSSITTKYDKP